MAGLELGGGDLTIEQVGVIAAGGARSAIALAPQARPGGAIYDGRLSFGETR
jgi:hypothetical protein